MSEKVLGFYEKDKEHLVLSIRTAPATHDAINNLRTYEVSVRLASESVDLKALKEKIKSLNDGDIFPEEYWKQSAEIHKSFTGKDDYPEFPDSLHNALVDFVIAIYAEVETDLIDWAEKEAKK